MILFTKRPLLCSGPAVRPACRKFSGVFLLRKVNEHALRCASRLNGRSLFFFFGGFGLVFVLVEVLARAAAAAEAKYGRQDGNPKGRRDFFHG